MINLLNPGDLKQIKAGRLNIRLFRHLLLTVGALAAIGAVYLYGFNRANQELDEAQKKIDKSSQEIAQYAQTKTDGLTYRTNLAMAKKILDNQFIFSDYLDAVAAIMPSGTVIDTLSLSTSSLVVTQGKAKSTVVPVRAKSYDGILSIKTAFETHPELFKDVHITATALTTATDTKSTLYPYTASFSVTIVQQKAGA